MKLENQVCSLEHAKRLKELGVPQESLFWWTSLETVESTESLHLGYVNTVGTPTASAFTVAELGEMLPWIIGGVDIGSKKNATIEFQKVADKFAVMYTEDNETLASFKDELLEQWDTTEADARALMLIYLLENNLLSAEALMN